jgi:P-type Ca2+ transporter type 2C
MGYPLLYLPIHIVWYETIIHPTALLVFQELPAQGPLRPLSQRQAGRFFSRGEWILIALSGSLLTVLLLWSYHRSLQPGLDIEHARAMAMVILSVASAATTAVLSGLRTRAAWAMPLIALGVAAGFVQLPWMASHLVLQPLHSDDWWIAASGGCISVALPVALFRISGWARTASSNLNKPLSRVSS